MDLFAAQQQYEQENSFPSERAEFDEANARTRYFHERKKYHLAHLEASDIDQLVFEEAKLLEFFETAVPILSMNTTPQERDQAHIIIMDAAMILLRSAVKEASKLAQEEADEADHDTLMSEEEK